MFGAPLPPVPRCGQASLWDLTARNPGAQYHFPNESAPASTDIRFDGNLSRTTALGQRMNQVADVVQSEPGQAEEPATDLDAKQLAEIVKKAGAGDEKAWRALIDLYSRRVYAMAKSRCSDPDQAEEITQSVFATIATKLAAGQYDEQGRFESWLFRVTMNRVRDEARRMKRHAQPTDPVEFGSVEANTDPAPATDTIQLNRLREAMCELSDSDREIVELRHHGAMSFKQMAVMLDEPVGTLLARHHRALRKLKAIIEGQMDSKPGETPNQESRGSDR